MTNLMGMTRRLFGCDSAGSNDLRCGECRAGLGARPQPQGLVWPRQFCSEDEFATFRAEYPEINVEFETIRLEDVTSQLILATRSGNAPDIVQIHARDVAQLAQGGVVKDFTHMIEEWKQRFPETYNQLSPLAWEGASDFDGNIYGLALYAQSIYLTYRTDWLDEAGIAYPLETTDRVLEAAKAISTLPDGGDRFGFSLLGCCNSPTWELPLFLAMGGQSINGVPQVDSEIGIAWIEFLSGTDAQPGGSS